MKKMPQRCKIGLNLYGVLLFVAIMLPNVVWAFVPAEKDVLRAESVTPALDVAASVFQFLTVAAVAVIVYGTFKSGKIPFMIALIPAAAYYVCWVVYYFATPCGALLVFMAVLPCLALILYAWFEKNYAGAAFGAVFMILHIVSTCLNFL